jgi:hypothetical protein
MSKRANDGKTSGAAQVSAAEPLYRVTQNLEGLRAGMTRLWVVGNDAAFNQAAEQIDVLLRRVAHTSKDDARLQRS